MPEPSLNHQSSQSRTHIASLLDKTQARNCMVVVEAPEIRDTPGVYRARPVVNDKAIASWGSYFGKFWPGGRNTDTKRQGSRVLTVLTRKQQRTKPSN